MPLIAQIQHRGNASIRQQALQKQSCARLSSLSLRAGVKLAFPVLTNTSAKIHCLLLLQKGSNFGGSCALVIGGGACHLFQTKHVLNHGGFAGMHRKGTGRPPPNGPTQDALRVVETSTGDFSPLETRAVKNTAAVSLAATLRVAVIQRVRFPRRAETVNSLTYSGVTSSLSRLQARHYYQIIKRPIDLSVIRAKLNKRSDHFYSSPEEFVADICLMFRNCAKFNYVGFFLFYFFIISYLAGKLNTPQPAECTRVLSPCEHSRILRWLRQAAAWRRSSSAS